MEINQDPPPRDGILEEIQNACLNLPVLLLTTESFDLTPEADMYENVTMFVVCQDVRFHSHVICPV
jgi:hypothetical protein